MAKASALFSFLPSLLFVFFFICTGAASSRDGHGIPPRGRNWKHRPGYHYRPTRNWINDPNGPMYYNGYYHLFYQYNYNGTSWGNIVWAHSISTDLINWKSLRPAIFPTKPFDQRGCWSGSTTILPGRGPSILYTGIDAHNNQVQNVAFPSDPSDPYLEEWVKPDFNPVMFPDRGLINASDFRDPTTAWMGPDGSWRTVVGGRRNRLGFAVLYRSRDFKEWRRSRHMLHAVADVGMWECPDFYPVATEGKDGVDTSRFGDGVKHVFKVSLDRTRYEYYTLGKYHAWVDKYVPDEGSIDNHTGLRYDYGNFYASKSFFDERSRRRILWGWSNESDTKAEDKEKGWSGIQVVPRKVWLDEDGRQLVQWPVEELHRLRHKEVKVRGVRLHGGSVHRVKAFSTSEADVEVTFGLDDVDQAEPLDPTWKKDPQLLCAKKGPQVRGGGIGPFGLLVLASADLRERTAVFFRVFRDGNRHRVLMCQDSTRSSFIGDVWRPVFGAFVDVDIAKEKKIALRCLIDNSVVESFGGRGKTVVTSRVYPVIAFGKDCNLFAFNNGTSGVKINLRAWHMNRPHISS